LQRACLQPAALALCASTRMVCVVARNALQPLQAAAAPECLHALAVREPAAAVLLSAPAASLGALPALARTRGEAAHVLAAAMFLAAALPGAAAARLGDALARDACGETLVAHEARAVELFAAHCGSLGARHVRHAARLLRRCDDPTAAVRGVLQVLAASPAAGADGADEADAFCASATMAGLCVAAFAGAAAARIEVARAVAVLLVAAAARPAEMPLADVPGALAAGVRVLGLCAVPHWVAAQPCVGGEPGASARGDSAFLSRFAVLSVARPAGPAEPQAPALFAYSVLHDAVARAHTLRFGGRTGAFADMVAEGMQAVAALVRDDVAFACAVERTQAAE
ncbi:hypothetical protein GGF37_007421, partial [Kickxella alabastrina]